MNYMNHICRFTVFTSFLMLCASAFAIELPVTSVGGKECYYYSVKPKETVFSICRMLGISRSELVKFNPSVSDGLRAGQTLYFPVDKLKGIDRKETTTARETIVPENSGNYATTQTSQLPKARFHHVSKGETIYGITHKYGITEEQLFALNPSVSRNGLKQGTILTLPDESVAATSQNIVGQTNIPEKEPVLVKENTSDNVTLNDSDNTVQTENSLRHDRIPVNNSSANTAYETESYTPDNSSSEIEVDSIRVSIILPFMLNDENQSKQTQLYTEFYRGFLMAADSLRSYGLPLHISAHDTNGSIDSVKALLQNEHVRKSDIIITPDNEDHLNELARFGQENSINIMNIFAVRNTAYTTNETVLQANIPHSLMYAKAVEELTKTYPDYQPVFLIPTEGKTDKMEFITELRNAVISSGKTFNEIKYDGMLSLNDLVALDRSKKYVFIPASGSQIEFSKIISALKSYKESLDDYSLVQLFGYPEWITFRKESLENMHFMNATIYSRFFNDAQSERSRNFEASYRKWFGDKPMNAIPVQGILGFDTGMFIIKALNDNIDHDADFELYYDGIQNNYHFIKPANGYGKINDSLYFINFRPSGIIDRRAI